jgi:hypothetical protein
MASSSALVTRERLVVFLFAARVALVTGERAARLA